MRCQPITSGYMGNITSIVVAYHKYATQGSGTYPEKVQKSIIREMAGIQSKLPTSSSIWSKVLQGSQQYGGHDYWTGHPRNFQLITSLVCERQYVWHDKISNRATQLESGCSKDILMHLAKQPYSFWYQHGLLASSIHHLMATHDFRLAKWRTCGLQKSNVSMINS